MGFNLAFKGLIKLFISLTDFRKKYTNLNVNENPSSGTRVFFHADEQTDRQTDRHDEANIRFSKILPKRLTKQKAKSIPH